MAKLIGRVSSVALFFFYIFPVNTYVLNSKYVVLIVAMYFLLIDILRRKVMLEELVKRPLYPILLAFTLSLVSLCSAFINQIFDPLYLYSLFSTLIYIVSAWGILRFMSNYYSSITFELIVLHIMFAVLLQCIISVMIYFTPDFRDILFSVIKLNPLEEQAIERTPFRLHGIGANFFNLGIINSVTLVLLTPLVFYAKGINKQILSFIFFIILIIGMMMSRTTIVALPFVFYLIHKLSNKLVVLLIKILLTIIFVIFVLSVFYGSYLEAFYDENSQLVEFGFEMFFNFFSGDGLTTGSSDQLSEVFYLPDNLLTFIIGDGRCTDPNDSLAYYMNTDLGICRQIFYFGFTGFIVWVVYYYQLYKATSCNYPHYRIVFLMLFWLCMLLNYKGITNLTAFFALFLFRNENFIRYKVVR